MKQADEREEEHAKQVEEFERSQLGLAAKKIKVRFHSRTAVQLRLDKTGLEK